MPYTYLARCIYGKGFNAPIEKHVKVTVDARLKYSPHGQCGVRKTDSRISLISYESTLINVDFDEIEGVLYGKFSTGDAAIDYSATSIKHVIYFLREYFPFMSYHDLKNIFKYHDEFWLLYDCSLVEGRPVITFVEPIEA